MSSIADALVLLSEESDAEPARLRKMTRMIKRDFKKKKWTKQTVSQLDVEWQWRIGQAMMTLGDMNWPFWEFRNIRDLNIPFEFPHWDGKEVNNLLIFGEQGIGDEIMFMSCYPNVKAKRVTIECEPRLAEVFRDSFDARVVGRVDFADASWVDEEYDAQVPMGELPVFFRRKREDFPGGPYLKPKPELVEKWKKKLPEGAVGVGWSGRQGYYPPEVLREDRPLVNLQYGPDYLETPRWMYTPRIDLTNDLTEVIALIAALDKVVCVPTSIFHYAGALGVPCEVILAPRLSGKVNNALNWRFVHGCMWHNSVTVYKDINEWCNRHNTSRTGTRD